VVNCSRRQRHLGVCDRLVAGMTELQLAALDFIRHRITEVGYAPTVQEIADEVGTCLSGAHGMIRALIAGGYLVRAKGAHRGLSLTDHVDLRGVGTSALRAELARRGVTLEALQVRESLAYGTRRGCAADSCGAEVRPGMLMCRTHWFMLGRDLQNAITQAFARRDTARYQELVAEARDIADGGQPWRRAG
jgi:hypothetical protein